LRRDLSENGASHFVAICGTYQLSAVKLLDVCMEIQGVFFFGQESLDTGDTF